jgi:hypothetical protein
MAPAQQADETIRSTNSSLHSLANSTANKQADRVKAYVDFSEYRRNYEEYMKDHGLDTDDNRPLSVIMKEVEEKAKISKDGPTLDRNKSPSSQSREDWVVLSREHSESSE